MSAGGQDARSVRAWARLVRSMEAIQQTFVARLDGTGLSLPYFSVLMVLYDAPEGRLPMSRIARDLTMTSGGFTKLADRMARDGLIDRRNSSGDRRVVFAALTETGMALAEKARDVHLAFLREEVLTVISPEELQALSAAAVRLGARGTEPEADPSSFEISARRPDAPERRAGDEADDTDPGPDGTDPDHDGRPADGPAGDGSAGDGSTGDGTA